MFAKYKYEMAILVWNHPEPSLRTFYGFNGDVRTPRIIIQWPTPAREMPHLVTKVLVGVKAA